jgi:SAM-dependent methyltransferase
MLDLSTRPPELQRAVERAAAGLPANVALMHLLLACGSADEADAALRTAAVLLRQSGQDGGADRLDAILALLRVNPGAFDIVHSVAGAIDHDRDDGSEMDPAARLAVEFDRAACSHPEASVALYSLGNSDIFAAATQEIVDQLDGWKLLSPEADALDLGCGIGRLLPPLASRLRHTVGVDLSRVMVEAAHRRCAALPNVEVRHIAGSDLAGFPNSGFDLVLAVDSFPYVVQSGEAHVARIFAEIARVLRPGGRLLILNFSYRRDPERDSHDVRRHAGTVDLSVERAGIAPFRLWDGVAFLLAKPATQGSR